MHHSQELFIKAINANAINVVEVLLTVEHVDPADEDNYAIRLASKNGYSDIVKLLLNDNRVDPTVRTNEPIFFAVQNFNYSVVELLWKNERVQSTLENDIPEIYNELKKAYLKNNIKSF